MSGRFCIMSTRPATLSSQISWTSQMAPLFTQLNPAADRKKMVSSVQGRQYHTQYHLSMTAGYSNPPSLVHQPWAKQEERLATG